MARSSKIEVVLVKDTDYVYISEGGQKMTSYLPAGTRLCLPVNWVYEPGLVERGEVKDVPLTR